MDYKFKKSNAEVKTIKGIQFGLISPEYIKNVSVTQEMEHDGKTYEAGIYNDVLSDQTSANIGSINDPRMGNMCDNEHPGYFGHIELVRPVYHIGFLKIIIDILRSVSHYTSTLIIDKESFGNKKGKRNTLKEVSKLSKLIKKCPVTGKKLPNYTKEGVKIAIDFGEAKQIISTSEVYKIFEKISDEDVEFLGMNPTYARPEWFLLKTIPVPPPHVRPSVYMNSSQKCDDDLTTKLNEIVKTNLALKTAIEKNNNDSGVSDHFISQLESLLQYNVSTFIDNQHPGQPPSLQRSGKPLKTLRERLGGKDGRVRGNLMGKRVDFSARTVITADPNLSIDQVGVPRAIAINLTIPEVVNDFNKEKLISFIRNGPNVYPGAKYIIKDGGSKIDLKYAKNILNIENGWVVERHLMDGDVVLFNRQPSLHKMSIMAHYVKVLDHSTFRLNLAVCSPYNADFDGDEMNLHVPQSLTAMAEAKNLMIVDKMIVSPQSNKPVMGIIQDSLLSSTKMTRRDVVLKKEYMMNLLMIVDNWNGNVPRPSIVRKYNGVTTEYWTGKQMFSTILPTNLNFNRVYDMDNVDDKGVLIINGNLVAGIVDKSIIGKSHGGLIHILFNDFGPETTKIFMNQVQKVANYWIKHNGFTMGVGDAIGGKVAMKSVQNILSNMKTKIEDIISNKEISNKNLLEEMINAELNSATSQAGKKAQESLTFDNNFNAAVTSGSKGSAINISQIMACVGQQNVEGRRIPYSFKNRSLPHFEKYDIGQISRGFVENSYISGLNPTEFFFHSMAGREGLIDTACKSVTGDTEILIMENGKTKNVKIGEWIDEYMKNNENDIRHENDRNMELLDVDECYIPTCDNDGNTSWGLLTSVTRHDPGDVIYSVKTKSGREVKVVESKSLLIYNKDTDKFESKLTSEVKIGDFVPTNINMPIPSIIHNYVDMTQFFPKKEYVYGTDYNYAIKCMNETMTIGLIGDKAGKKAKEEFNRTKIPKGWWDKSNGTIFTLPYTKKSSLQRALVRSAPLEDGCVYPYSASRDNNARFPDKFELNNENGLFIGLFLAEGHARPLEGTVDIANNDPVIRKFVESWFDKYNIKHSERIEKKLGCNGNTWTSSTVRGFSTLLAKFLHLCLGHKSEGKYVPDFAFNAPDEFVIGLLNGYFSGDGSVNGNGITVLSVSKELINGINLLCNRFGVFGSITEGRPTHNIQGSLNLLPNYTYNIRGQWSKIFAEKIPMIEKNKQDKLDHIVEHSKVKKHINYKAKNNVVLDKIVSIEKISTENYPKVYDVTVPSTLNFMIFNGIHGSDTAETGYVQRRLVKALEDVSVKYDNTVRNSRGLIVQFLYGEDAIDATYMESVEIELLKKNEKQFKEEYDNGIVEETELLRKCQRELIGIAKYRGVNNSKLDDCYFPLSVNIQRILTHVRKNIKTDETPMMPEEIYKQVYGLCSRIENVFRPNVDFEIKYTEKERSKNATRLFRIYIMSCMASKKISDLTKSQLYYLVEEIEMKYRKSIAAAGEMCGIVAAQSIGEPATQMSCHKDTLVTVLRPDNTIYRGKVSEFMDPFFGETEIVDVDKYKIIGVSEDEKVSWKDISQLSRHKANGKLVKVNTMSGKTTTATLSHSFLKRTVDKIVPVLGSELKVGDRIPVCKNVPIVENPLYYFDGFKLDRKFGKIIASYFEERIQSFVFHSNLEFIAGILEYYFGQNNSITLNTEQLAIDIVHLLSHTGIFAIKRGNTVIIEKYDDEIPALNDVINSIHSKIDVVIKPNRLDIIHFIQKYENNPLIESEVNVLKQAAYSDVVWDEITSLEILDDPKEFVYDFTVPGNQSFMVDCGVLVHNTLNSVEYNTGLIIDWTADTIPPVRPNEVIGKFIDSLIEKYPEKCELQPDGHTIYLPLEKGTAKAMSTDENGNVVWTELEAVTRHPPINEDGSNTLLKVTTESGREAIATKAKSFLVFEDDKIIGKNGSDIKIGDLIPIARVLRPQEFRTCINLQNILNPREYVFTNNMIEAKKVMLEAKQYGPRKEWFYLVRDKVPYNRSDALRVALERAMLSGSEEVETGSKRAKKTTAKAHLMFVPNKVYPKSWGKFEKNAVNGIPSTIELDREFGFLIGAYLAEGCVTDFQVIISNNDDDYRKMTTAWTDKQNISSRLNYSSCGGPELNKGKDIVSTSICIHSTILRHLIVELCGRGAYEKRVPEFAYSAPDEFVKGLLDAYICGDGCICANGSMDVKSRSKMLRDGISLLLMRLGIRNKLRTHEEINKKDKTDPDGEYKPMYQISSGTGECCKFDFITAIDYKAERQSDNSHKTPKIYKQFNDVYLDSIISIEEIVSEHPYVYDLTVQGTKNMAGVDGFLYRDTFHYAGVSAKNVTLGVPRLKELINVTKSLKTPSLTMYESGNVSEINETGQKRIAETIRSTIEYKTLQDIIQSSDIIDSNNEEFIKDNDTIEFYKQLYKFDTNCIPDSFKSLRFSFKAKDLEYVDISITEISKLIYSQIADENIKVICSDDNDPNLFIRIIVIDEETANDLLRKLEIFCMPIKLKGIEGIERVYAKEAKVNSWDPEKGHHKKTQWVFETEGANLLNSMEIEGIDHTKTISNDVLEIYEIFGVEAARQALLNELVAVLSFDGSYVNYRHLDILVDTMTCRGNICAVTRHGINRLDVGPLTKCSFEETVEIITDAAAFSELDPLKGISDNIMLGQMIPAGTGVIDTLYDFDMKPEIKKEVVVTRTKFVPSEPTYDPLMSF
jgi:DNA-directed RNA polymerase beta' subunit